MEFVLIECQKFDFSINKYTPLVGVEAPRHIVLKDVERFVKCECATAHWKPSFRGVSGSLCGGGGPPAPSPPSPPPSPVPTWPKEQL